MTLPSLDKPSISTKVETILSDIVANQEYLDATVAKYKMCKFSRTTVEGTGISTITGIGFEPSAIILFSDCSYSMSSGFYSPSTGYLNACMYQKFLLGGEYVLATRLWTINPAYSVCWYVSTTGGVTYVSMRGSVATTNSDGFTFNWIKAGTEATAVTCNVIALCVK